MAPALALLAAALIGTAVVTSKFGLRSLDARTGAAISLPSSTLAMLTILPLAWDGRFTWHGAFAFAIVGFFYPGLVTILRFFATDRLGPATTSTVLASTSPIFALLAAATWLHEHVPARAVLATCGVVCGILLVSYGGAVKQAGARTWATWWLAVPLAAGLVSGCAQAGVRNALSIWPNPFAATLIGYIVSSLVVLAFAATRQQIVDRPPVRRALWFVLTGVLNAVGVLALFAALSYAPVSVVAPIVAGYPVVTLFLGAALLREETINPARIGGATLTVASIAYLM